MSIIRAYIVNNKGSLQLVDSNHRISPTSVETMYRNPKHEVEVVSLVDTSDSVLEQYTIDLTGPTYIATVEGSYGYCLQALDKASKNELPLGIPQIVC
jgi:hypothetical protein